jgi:hypothetical protein
MCGAITPLPQYVFMVWCSVNKRGTGTTLHLPLPLTYPKFKVIAFEDERSIRPKIRTNYTPIEENRFKYLRCTLSN